MLPHSVARESTHVIARRITLTGRVQGLGVRPAIARLAEEFQLAGSVSNRLDGVEVNIEGAWQDVEQFQRRLLTSLPQAAEVEEMTIAETRIAGQNSFVIEEQPATGLVRTQIPQDLAVCADCLADVANELNRRHNYAFTSCTDCGPRYSIIDVMPYERRHTTMASFVMCPACQSEYSDVADRRFHAQTNACPVCGPRLWCVRRDGRVVARDTDALQVAAESILGGQIVAIRGIGGYQLVCDATSNQAVERLRERKRRPIKPLAVMVADLPSAERLAELNTAARELLVSAANPIVLLTARSGNGLAKAIHPKLHTVGILLPTSPLHWLLVRNCRRALVVTSGNREGDPLVVEVPDALEQLRDIADLWLHHDRPIARPVDDSVQQVVAGRPMTLRFARGLAPWSLELPQPAQAVAVGGQQKTAIAASNGAQAILGAHLGDSGSLKVRERFIAEATKVIALYGVSDPLWIHDLHPDYLTTQWAQVQLGRRLGVQHHHAHVAATMLEQGWLDGEVFGVAFDGTGYGTDGTIWGGEFLLATASHFRRVGHLREFALPGGEVAIREPWRVAVALVQQTAGRDAFNELLSGSRHAETLRLLPLLERPRLSPRTTSAGRLFDGVAALALGIEFAEFEGFPAMRLEAIADRTVETAYTFTVDERTPFQLDWRVMIVELLTDLRSGTAAATIAMRFHRGFAAAIATICRRHAPYPIALGGGVFQNRLLVELFLEGMTGSHQPVGIPRQIPPNDGGLAAGQLAVGIALARRKGD